MKKYRKKEWKDKIKRALRKDRESKWLKCLLLVKKRNSKKYKKAFKNRDKRLKDRETER